LASIAKEGQTRWLVELKDYSETGGASDPQKRQIVDYLDREFVDKAKDCLLVLGSVWHHLPKQALLEPNLPSVFRQLPSQIEGSSWLLW
jgi:hypothetical protein